ncbi:MAG TPA: 30S ribosomal protein S20 [Candidatus Eisenbacteria bacterium]|jgi:small subunit ribosomal protein S20
MHRSASEVDSPVIPRYPNGLHFQKPPEDPEERMPRHKSAVKRVHTNLRDQKRNLTVKSELKTLLKKARQEPENETLMRSVTAKLDRAVRKGVLHKTVANRRKSRLARMVNRTTRAS